MIIEPPKTVLDFKIVEKSILEMYVSLEKKLKKCRDKIEQLEAERK